MKQISKSESTKIDHNGKSVKGKTISVSSLFHYNTEKFFHQELIKTNTKRIVKPLASITFLKENQDSEFWKEGFNYKLVIKPFGLINIWGVHHIHVVKIDTLKTEIITIEKNALCKVWDHRLTFKKINPDETEYTDEVALYAGWLTPILSHFLIYSYKKRHQNWNKLLAEK